MELQTLEHFFGVAGQKLELFERLLRLDEAHELDLVELMLADQPAHVFAVRTGFAAKTRRVRGVRARQRRAFEDLVGVQIRDRHFRRRNQVERARIVLSAAPGLEQVVLEFRQLPGAAHRLGVDQKWRINLGVAVLAGVQIEHEGDQRALEPRAEPPQHRETRAADLGRALEVQNAQRGAELPVRLRLEIEARLCRPTRGRPDCRRRSCPRVPSGRADSAR